MKFKDDMGVEIIKKLRLLNEKIDKLLERGKDGKEPSDSSLS